MNSGLCSLLDGDYDDMCGLRPALSMIMVTGPSFTSITSMWAPNTPVCTLQPAFLRPEQRSSYNVLATLPSAARVKLGLLPRVTSPYKVN